MNIFQGPAAASVSIDSNYLTAWGLDAYTIQFDVRAANPSKTYRLNSEACEPELVVHRFLYNDFLFLLVTAHASGVTVLVL